MRRYDIVSGILLILSIIDFALAAPISAQEKRQTCVDVVNIPKDVITVLGKRGEEELAKLAEEFAKTWGKPIDSSDVHTSSSSAPPGPDHESTDVVQGPAPNTASSTANSGLLMQPSSPPSTGAIPDSFEDRFNAAWDKAWDKADKGSDTSLGSMFTSEYGSDTEPEWATAHVDKVNPIPIPIPGPSTGADPYFDWEHWQNAPSPPKPSSPNEFGLAPEHQMGHVQQLNTGPSTGVDPDFNWNRWSSEDDPLALAPRPLATSPQKEVRPTVWGIPWPDDPPGWNTWLTTEPDSEPNLMATHQPPPYPLSSTELDNDHDVNQPLPDAPAATDFYSYSYPGSEVHPPVSPSAWLPEVPEHGSEEGTPASPGAGSPTVSEHEEVTPPSPGAGSLTVPEHEEPEATPPSPDLGSPKEPENEVVPGPPSTPESTDPEDPQSLSAGVQPEDLRAAMYANEDLQAAMYAAKGKAKESRSIAGTATDVGNASQRELQPAESSLDPGE
jgi:hypothetical protein